MQQQQRFILFVVLAVGILLGWNYLFPIKNPQQQNANNSNNVAQEQQQQASPTGAPAGSPAGSPTGSQAPQVASPQPSPGSKNAALQTAAPATPGVEHK